MKQFTIFNQLTAMPKRLAMVLTVLFTLGVGSVLGADVTFTTAAYNGKGGASGTGGDATATIDGVTITSTKAYYTSAHIREYSGGTITVSSSSNITKIVFTSTASGTSNNGPGKISLNSGGGSYSYSGTAGTWTGSSTSIEFDCDAQFRWTKIVVTTKDADPYTVTFHTTATKEEEIEEASAGAGVTPPTMEKECGDWTFQGWSESSSNSEDSTTPLSLVTLTSGKYYPTKDIDLYPVYTKSEGGGGTAFDKYTQVALGGTITSGKYLISTGSYTMAGNRKTGASFSPGTTEKTAYEYTVTVDGSYFTILGPDGKYVGGNDNTSLAFGTTVANDSYRWKYVNSGIQNKSYTTRHIKAYGTTDFRHYGTSDGTLTYLYKRTEKSSGATYYYSYPQCADPCASLAAPSVTATNITSNSFTLSWNAVDGATSYNVYNYTTEDMYETTSTSYTFTGLSASTEYEWEIEAAKGECFNGTKGSTTTSAAPVTTYTVTYNLNGGTGTTPTEGAKAAGAQFNLAASTGFSKTGYRFMGWNDGTTTYAAGAQYTMPAKNVTLTAQWKTILKLATPANLEVTNITCSGATLTWDNVANNNGYLLSVKNTSSGTSFNSDIAKDVTSGSPTLNPGTTYTWKVTAKGDGTNYNDSEVAEGGSFTTNYKITYNVKGGTWTACADGCVAGGEDFTICSTVPTKTGYNFMGWSTADDQIAEYQAEKTIENVSANITLYAVWEQPKYTVNWYVNGTSKREQTDVEGAALTDIPEPTTADCDNSKVFVGWTTIADYSDATDAPDGMITNTTGMTMPEGGEEYYAVFATPGSGGGGAPVETTTTLDFSAQGYANQTVISSLAIDDITATFDKGSNSNVPQYYSKGTAVRVYGGGNFTVSAATGCTITKIVITFGSGDGSNTITATEGLYTSGTWTGSAQSVKFTIGGTTGHRRIKTVSVTFATTTQGGTSYSDYVTSCVALPDPVISFVTTPADPIVFDPVNCGSTTTKAQAKTVQVSGANLQEYVSVEVTGPYKIARTSSTNLSDYTTSLTLDKTNTGNINANYSTIYIISCPPVQSTDATTGTLTFTTKKGNTLTVNLSTPTVNCTQYTLTLNDRGTKTTAEYYAGASVLEPEDPTGVCTDPIHYVFDGWAEATVANGSTEYTKVTFPYSMPGQNKTLYAVYRYLTSGGNGDYNLVTSALDDWSGDYLIAYSDQIFANGKIGGESGIGAKNNKVDLSSNISNNTIPATVGDQYNVTLEAVTGGYVLKTQDGKYNYHTNNTGNGISASTIGYADDYPITVKFVSEEEINLCLGGTATGSVFRYNAQGFFRFYKNGGQNPVYLYKKADGTTYYTTSPVCGPHLAITEGKEIYVTGGNAGGTRDLVIAQQKVSYKATRLEKDKSTGNLPSIKALPSNIIFDNNKTKAVTITFDEDSVRTLQSDGTYTITGNITIAYQPAAANVTDDIQVVLNANYNPSADVSNASFTVHARSLPQEFVIVAKQGDKWYALNGDMSNGSSANPANGQITLNDDTEPTKATYAPCNTIYTFDGLPNTGDRTRVRFQGTDGAWLWAASGTNVGIQNKTLAQTPAGDNAPYNWKLETEDNITYKFHNDNNSRLLGLNGEKFGMYASAVNDIRILPYEAKCLYNYAPTNLKVSVLKGSYVTLTWDAVAGATKYQYSDDATNWTDAGTEPTVTISGLSKGTDYIYYVRAYHADAGVSQECFDYSEVSFTTADCDDVPTNITYTADLNSITVSWTATASTATVKLYSDEAGATTVQTLTDATSPCKFADLTKNTTYYVQVFAGGTCASQIVPVNTEDIKVDVVEWQPQGIVVDINTNERVGVTLENEVSYGSGTGAEATELFFSKYYEATTNVKLVAIYNGTKNLIDLTEYEIHYGKTSWESQYITLKDFGATKGQIQPGEEIILYTMSDKDDSDRQIMACVNGDYPDGKWVRVTQSNNDGKGHLSFAGDKTIVLKKEGTVIDVIGALTSGGLPTNNAVTRPSWGDANGWTCATGLSIADDTQIGISTNRCLLIRNNSVTSGENAVTSNIDDFVTLCSEWKGAQVPDSDEDNGVAASCENFAYVGTFDYSDYYTQYESMGEEIVFEENVRNADGTVNVPITDLYKQSCRNIRITLEDKDGNVLSNREYKVPIMITTTQGTDGQTFIDLQQNLAMIETDSAGNVVATHPLSLEDVREICKTCDVVIRNNATLMKVADDEANDHPQVRDIYVYENSSLIVPNGTNYTINNLSLRRKQDSVASLNVYPGALKLPESAPTPISLDLRVDANNWHWFTLPYDCNISEVTWVDGSPAQYNVDWFLMTYDGEQRANTQSGGCWKQYNGTTIEAGKGYIVGITGDINNSDYTFELRFPMAKEVLADETKDKIVDVHAWGVETNIRPNHKGWNLVGNPYLAYYQRDNINSFEGLRLGELVGPDPQTGYWEQTGNLPYVVVPVEGGWVSYEQVLVSETDILPFTAYFVQVGNDGTHNSTQDLKVSFDHTKLQLSATPMPASIVHRAPSEVNETEEPVIVGVALTNSLGESDKTSLVIADRFTNEYEMQADFFKWFGDYYKYYTKPVLYTIGADQGKRAFNALNEQLATQPIPMGLFAAKAGDYTFALNRRSDLSKVEEVWLHDANTNTYTNLMQNDYNFYTTKTDGGGRFTISVKLAPKVATGMENVNADKVWATTQNQQIIVNGLENNTQLWMYDAAGKLLYTEVTSNYQHRYSVPQVGTYFIALQKGTTKQTIKVVVE